MESSGSRKHLDFLHFMPLIIMSIQASKWTSPLVAQYGAGRRHTRTRQAALVSQWLVVSSLPGTRAKLHLPSKRRLAAASHADSRCSAKMLKVRSGDLVGKGASRSERSGLGGDARWSAGSGRAGVEQKG